MQWKCYIQTKDANNQFRAHGRLNELSNPKANQVKGKTKHHTSDNWDLTREARNANHHKYTISVCYI